MKTLSLVNDFLWSDESGRALRLQEIQPVMSDGNQDKTNV